MCVKPLHHSPALGLVALLYVACAPEPEAAPPHLVGVWETSVEGYADQHIFIDHHRIGFGTSSVTADGYVIERVTQQSEDARTLYVISYRGADDARFQLAVYYEPVGGGRLTFKNQHHLTWIKKESVP
jgi:hypothetical protein